MEIRDQLFISYSDLCKPLPLEWDNNPYTCRGRCLIETLEFKVESAKNQFASSTTTCKVLVALSPAGSPAFVSQCYDGNLSDRDIVQYSGTAVLGFAFELSVLRRG